MDRKTLGHKTLLAGVSPFRSGKSDPVQFKRGLKTGALWLAKMGILQATFLLWGIGILRDKHLPQKRAALALKRPFSKPYLNWTGSVFRLLILGVFMPLLGASCLVSLLPRLPQVGFVAISLHLRPLRFYYSWFGCGSTWLRLCH